MAGLLHLIPRYLPRFGMAPEWARASRPLVLVFVSVAFAVTLLFHADVDAQGGAYATGVLVLITSASLAVTFGVHKPMMRLVFALLSLIFIYTTLVNIDERPEGLKISCVFIFAMILVSLISRAVRSTELRITDIALDDQAQLILSAAKDRTIRLIARNPMRSSTKDCGQEEQSLRSLYGIGAEDLLIFIEVDRGDSSEFEDHLRIQGRKEGDCLILHAKSVVVANSIAALLLYLERTTGCVPHVYFHWTDVNPVVNAMRFVFLGEGDTAPLTHEVLRRAVKDVSRRPVVHVS